MAANKPRVSGVSCSRLALVSVLDAVERGETVSQARLGRELGIHPSTVSQVIALAMDQGMLVRTGRGRYRLGPAAVVGST